MKCQNKHHLPQEYVWVPRKPAAEQYYVSEILLPAGQCPQIPNCTGAPKLIVSF